MFSQCCGVSSTIAAQPNIQTILRGGKRFEFVWLKQVQIKTLGAEGSASAPLERDSRRLSRWFREEERMGYPPPPILGLQRPHCQDAKAPRGGLSGAVSVRTGSGHGSCHQFANAKAVGNHGLPAVQKPGVLRCESRMVPTDWTSRSVLTRSCAQINLAKQLTCTVGWHMAHEGRHVALNGSLVPWTWFAGERLVRWHRILISADRSPVAPPPRILGPSIGRGPDPPNYIYYLRA